MPFLEPESTGTAYTTLNHVGLNRLAFRVSNIDATVASLRERGITFLKDEPQVFGDGIRSIVTKDPDGVSRFNRCAAPNGILRVLIAPSE